MPQTLSSDTPDKGRLRIHVDSALTRSPVENARIRIFDTGQPEKALEEIGTDADAYVIRKIKDSIDRYAFCFGMYGLTSKLLACAEKL